MVDTEATGDEPTGPPSVRVYAALRAGVLHGEFHPEQPLKPQELATRFRVSLAVIRESLLRLVGEGLAERLPNRGFAVPSADDARWQEVAEARAVVEPAMLRMAIARGDLDWESRVRATHHRLTRTPTHDDEGPHVSDAWAAAHYAFHRALLSGCGNSALLATFDRLWTASELARRWSGHRQPARDHVGEHRQLEQAALARDADGGAAALERHVTNTAAALAPGGGPEPRQESRRRAYR